MNSTNLNAIVGGMEANGVQRTPLVNRINGGAFSMANPTGHARNVPHRQPFPNFGNTAQDRSFTSANVSDRSASAANEVENMLLRPQSTRNLAAQNGWQLPNPPQSNRSTQRVFATTDNNNPRPSRGFRPAITR
ncbi:hypothetical protein HYPSUDRAFT_85935 [Hypholoma sublateritium FD-334 SS-4]|uniref:Uncharacterized protein n=1 Tax=Hypholoma sublateritium (strain FD-334 SS-4) TaxID=945553 RepID=A0A0D2P7B3_HYPSF|nr:hypothetical protein HYPSUDRAFT_85935 [Hypholoma sublateritium FD-334 SS-4]